MQAEQLTAEDLARQYTILQPPPTRFTLYAWREALGLDQVTAFESQGLTRQIFEAIQEFTGAPERDHRRINRMLMSARRLHDPIDAALTQACQDWLAQQVLAVEEEVLPAQGFRKVYELFTPEDGGGCRAWERGEDLLFVNDDRAGWAYVLTTITREDLEAFQAGITREDYNAVIRDLIEVLNALAGPDLPENERLVEELNLDGAGYLLTLEDGEEVPSFPDYLRGLREDLEEYYTALKTPEVQPFLTEIRGLAWEDLAPRLVLEKRRRGL